MSISRRKFLGTGSVVALTAGLPLKALAEGIAGSPNPKSNSLLPSSVSQEAARLNSEAFSRCLNTTFRLRKANADASILKLIGVNHWAAGRSTSRTAATARECFSAIFVSTNNVQLRQDTYAAEHPSLGKFQLMIVPMGKNKQGLVYEAVFNRLY